MQIYLFSSKWCRTYDKNVKSLTPHHIRITYTETDSRRPLLHVYIVASMQDNYCSVPDGHHGVAAGAGARKGTVGTVGMEGMTGKEGIVTLGMLGMANKGGSVEVGMIGIGGTASFGTVGTTGIGDDVGSEGGSAAGASAVSGKWRAAPHVKRVAKIRDVRKLIL